MKITYRLVEEDDSYYLFALKNDGVVRANSIQTKKKIKWEDHEKWFADAMEDPLTEIWIMEDGKKFVGDVRIQDSEIAIKIEKEYRGKGLGSKAIKKFSRPGLLAKITEGNVASMRVFIACGYELIDYVKGNPSYYLFTKK